MLGSLDKRPWRFWCYIQRLLNQHKCKRRRWTIIDNSFFSLEHIENLWLPALLEISVLHATRLCYLQGCSAHQGTVCKKLYWHLVCCLLDKCCTMLPQRQRPDQRHNYRMSLYFLWEPSPKHMHCKMGCPWLQSCRWHMECNCHYLLR